MSLKIILIMLALSGVGGIALGYVLRVLIGLAQRGSVELDIKQSRLVITRKNGQHIESPVGLPSRLVNILVPLTVTGLVEKYSRGSLSVRSCAGLDSDGNPLPVGTRSACDDQLTRQKLMHGQSGLVSIGEALAANTQCQVFIFEVIAYCDFIEPTSFAS